MTRKGANVDVVFGGGLWPIGWGVAFVERPLEDVQDRYRAWLPTWDLVRLGSAPLLRLLEHLLPLEMPYTRRLLVGTRGGWTAIFDNSRRGRRHVSAGFAPF